MSDARVGFRFNPTEEELVRHYLADRVAGNSEKLWQGLINEFDVYSEEPWELWRRFYRPNLVNYSETKADMFIYCFTTLRRIASGGNGKRVNRRVGRNGGGTWHIQNAKISHNESGLFSWCHRRFTYKNTNRGDEDGGWVMMELCRHEDDSLVVCRIGKKPTRGGEDEVSNNN